MSSKSTSNLSNMPAIDKVVVTKRPPLCREWAKSRELPRSVNEVKAEILGLVSLKRKACLIPESCGGGLTDSDE